MDELLKIAKNYLYLGKVEQVSETMWKVDEDLVKLHVKPGRNIFSCSCENYSRFCVENPCCSHVLSVILFEGTKKIQIKATESIKTLGEYEKLGVKMEPKIGIQMIEDLKGLYGK